MNKLDKIELQSELEGLKTRQEEVKNSIGTLPEVANSLGEMKELDKEFKANAARIAEIESKLSQNSIKKETNTMKYLESKNSVADFMDILKHNPLDKKSVHNAWNEKLVENGITITDTTLQLPRKIVESIESALLETNPVFKAFRVTHLGAVIVSQLFGSTDEALVHEAGTTKTIQAATLEVSSLRPRMIYKLQTIAEEVKRLNQSYDELYAFVVAELTQAIVNKVVDLALIEGTANGTLGFISIMNEPSAEKVLKVTAAAADEIIPSIEQAVDFVRPTFGKKYLIVTVAQRAAILAALRALATGKDYVRNTDEDIAYYLGVEEVIVYSGSKAISPIVLVDQKYHVDMADITKVDAFRWETNENAILIETLAGGHVEGVKSAAVITLPEVGA